MSALRDRCKLCQNKGTEEMEEMASRELSQEHLRAYVCRMCEENRYLYNKVPRLFRFFFSYSSLLVLQAQLIEARGASSRSRSLFVRSRVCTETVRRITTGRGWSCKYKYGHCSYKNMGSIARVSNTCKFSELRAGVEPDEPPFVPAFALEVEDAGGGRASGSSPPSAPLSTLLGRSASCAPVLLPLPLVLARCPLLITLAREPLVPCARSSAGLSNIGGGGSSSPPLPISRLNPIRLLLANSTALSP